MTTVADRVREARLASGLSQTALAGSAFSPSYISLIEAGRREPTDSALAVLAKRLDTTLEYLRYGDDGPNESRTRVQIDHAGLELADGRPQDAKARLEQIDLTPVTPTLRLAAMTTLARTYTAVGDLEGAVALLEPLLDEARSRHQHLGVAVLANALVGAYLEAGDLHRGVEIGERALADLQEFGMTGSDEQLRLASTTLWAYVERGDVLYASHRAAELIALAEEAGTPRGRGGVYWNAALVAEERRDYDLAHEYTRRAAVLLEEGGPSRDLARLRLHHAWLMLRTDPSTPREALELLDSAGRELEVIGTHVDRARVDVERSRAHLQLGRPGEARRAAESALDRLGTLPRLETAEARLALAAVQETGGDADGATDSYRLAADLLSMMSASRQSAAVWRDLGDGRRRLGDVEGALDAYDKALAEAGLRSAPDRSVAASA